MAEKSKPIYPLLWHGRKHSSSPLLLFIPTSPNNPLDQVLVFGPLRFLVTDVTLSNGDLNGDGAINAVDVQLSLNALLGYNIGLNADVDGQGISATDLQQVMKLSIGVH